MALALIVIPVVIRTTENMLSLIPNALREAAYALGTPKWKVISSVTLKAARAGVVTGVLLAVARISGGGLERLFAQAEQATGVVGHVGSEVAQGNDFWCDHVVAGPELDHLPKAEGLLPVAVEGSLNLGEDLNLCGSTDRPALLLQPFVEATAGCCELNPLGLLPGGLVASEEGSEFVEVCAEGVTEAETGDFLDGEPAAELVGSKPGGPACPDKQGKRRDDGAGEEDDPALHALDRGWTGTVREPRGEGGRQVDRE